MLSPLHCRLCLKNLNRDASADLLPEVVSRTATGNIQSEHTEQYITKDDQENNSDKAVHGASHVDMHVDMNGTTHTLEEQNG